MDGSVITKHLDSIYWFKSKAEWTQSRTLGQNGHGFVCPCRTSLFPVPRNRQHSPGMTAAAPGSTYGSLPNHHHCLAPTIPHHPKEWRIRENLQPALACQGLGRCGCNTTKQCLPLLSAALCTDHTTTSYAFKTTLVWYYRSPTNLLGT